MTDYQSIIDYHQLSMEILNISNNPYPRYDYFYLILKNIKNYTQCEVIELWFKENGGFSICNIDESNKFNINTESINKSNQKDTSIFKGNSFLDLLRHNIFLNKIDSNLPFLNSNRTFWWDEQNNSFKNRSEYKDSFYGEEDIEIIYNSFALIPIYIKKNVVGLLQLMSNQKNFIDKKKIKLFEGIVNTLSIAIINKQAQGALRERVKELSCLYNISKVSENETISLKETLQQIVNLIPPAWQFPESTVGQIFLDGQKTTSSENFKEYHSQDADIFIKGEKRGFIKTIYTTNKPVLDEGPFLKEERSLINAIAKQVGLIIERREAEEEKKNLQEQIRHADRLATIGQLAAGIAHELNEPLGNILGFAQLIKKYPELSFHALEDVDKIINASLHAREIIKKLMLFSRQTPPKRTRVNINELVKEGLYFFEARCTKVGINLIRNLKKNIPEIEGDSGQLNQVLVNLVVNSIQAMPRGGDLRISTTYDRDNVSLIVEDSGIGMSEELKSKIFIPFFTTKDINEGTGLGLAVVHGIVLSHKGSIEFESEIDKGSRFKIKLPI